MTAVRSSSWCAAISPPCGTFCGASRATTSSAPTTSRRRPSSRCTKACTRIAAPRDTTWLFRIAYHTFLNDQRGRHAADEFSEDEHGSVADTTAHTPERALADEEFSANVLARLPPRSRPSAVRRWTVAGSAALGSVLTLAFAAPLETVVSSIAPWSIPRLALSAVAVIAIVEIPAFVVFYTERADR